MSTLAGAYGLFWRLPLIDQDREMHRRVRRLERDVDALLDDRGTTLRYDPGLGPIAAGTLIVDVGDPDPVGPRVEVRSLVRHRSGRSIVG